MERTESASPKRPSSGRIPGLDGLRAISILLVLVGHGAATFPKSNSLEPILPYVGNSALGVLTFFVISGYLITYLLRKEWERSGTIRLRAFYARRVLRIFPAFYAFLVTVALLRAAGHIDTTYADIAVSGFFLNNYKYLLSIPSNDGSWFVGHFWTLSLEEQFYLLWPATILTFGIFRAPRIAFFIVLAAPVARVVTYLAWPGARGEVGTMLHTAADPLMIGCLAALLQGWRPLEKILDKLTAWYWPLLAGVYLLVVSVWLTVQFRGAYGISVGISLNGVGVAFILLWVVRYPTSLLSRGLSAPLLCHIGIISYSLYLWQQLFLTTRNTTWSGLFPVNFVACFVVAELSYWLIESPFLRFRGRFRADRRVPTWTNGDDVASIREPDRQAARLLEKN